MMKAMKGERNPAPPRPPEKRYKDISDSDDRKDAVALYMEAKAKYTRLKDVWQQHCDDLAEWELTAAEQLVLDNRCKNGFKKSPAEWMNVSWRPFRRMGT
jgi:hypothetical protein